MTGVKAKHLVRFPHLNGEVLLGKVFIKLEHVVGVEIVHPYHGFQNFWFKDDLKDAQNSSWMAGSGADGDLDQVAKRLLLGCFEVLKNIDESFERYSGVYRDLQAELELAERVGDADLRMEIQQSMLQWFYKELGAEEMYNKSQILTFFEQYLETGKSPFGTLE